MTKLQYYAALTLLWLTTFLIIFAFFYTLITFIIGD